MALIICGKKVRSDAQGLVSLTDLYAAANAVGMADGKRDPRRWKLQDGEQFIAFVREQLNVPLRDIYKSARGRGSGTYAHWQIALAYAKYLPPANFEALRGAESTTAPRRKSARLRALSTRREKACAS